MPFSLKLSGASLFALAAFALPAVANDTVFELSTGGIVPVQTDAIEMAKEVLTITPETITVDYVFRNVTDRDVTATIAFPMPQIQAGFDWMAAIPQHEDNFLGFTVSMDGRPITPALVQTATAEGGHDVTQVLADYGIPLLPVTDDIPGFIGAMKPKDRRALTEIGLIAPHWDDEEALNWTVHSTYTWEATFPAGREVTVHHSYATSLGGTSAIGFVDANGLSDGDYARNHARTYCMDPAFISAVARKVRAGTPMGEGRISYVLGTGANWAGGRIGDFTLIVDKGRTNNLVSFCGEGVEKIGPTTFRMHKTNYAPPDMLEILLVMAAE